jgi:hypothetical protein
MVPTVNIGETSTMLVEGGGEKKAFGNRPEHTSLKGPAFRRNYFTRA